MQSIRRKGLIYTDINTEILEHDDDIDAEEFILDDQVAYRGVIDPRYVSYNLDVQWIYNDLSEKIGLVEYESEDRTQFSQLRFYSNPYATFFQEPDWKTTNQTVWTRMPNEAYQDCLETDFQNLVDMSLKGTTRIVLPSMLQNTPTTIYECVDCGKRTLSRSSGCPAVKKLSFLSSSIMFLDDSYVIYEPPVDSAVWMLFNMVQKCASTSVPSLKEPEQALARVQEPRLDPEPQYSEQSAQMSVQVPEEPLPTQSEADRHPQYHPQTHLQQSSSADETPVHTKGAT